MFVQQFKVVWTCHLSYTNLLKGAVSRNSAKLGFYKMPVKLRETWK